MIVLRCISFLIGSLIVTGAPFFLLPDAPQRPNDSWVVLTAFSVIVLLSSGFFFIGLAGNHMKRSRRARAVAALLLGFPMIGSIWVLLLDDMPQEMWMTGPLLCLAVLLFIAFVYPASRRRMYRPLRPREPLASNDTANA